MDNEQLLEEVFYNCSLKYKRLNTFEPWNLEEISDTRESIMALLDSVINVRNPHSNGTT